MGIPEGMDEIPVGKALPLEYNLDYMNGGIFIAAIHCISHVSLIPKTMGLGTRLDAEPMLYYLEVIKLISVVVLWS